MLFKSLLPLVYCICTTPVLVFTQVEKTLFQTFNMDDATKKLIIQTADNYELKTWNGVQLMIETTARLDGGSMDILSMFIKEGRYNFSLDKCSEICTLKPKNTTRAKVNNQGVDCVEKIKHLIYVPEEFNIASKTELIRKELIIAKGRNR